MTEIHILPAHSHRADHITRSTADLIEARERGVDLGSRVAHIHANGETLLSMSHGFERALHRLRQSLHQLGMQDQLEEAALRQLLENVQQLADNAKDYPIGT